MNELEPQATVNDSETKSLRSIAISLKRIADALEVPKVTGSTHIDFDFTKSRGDGD